MGMSSGEIHGLIDQDSGEEIAHGQTVRDTFPNADCFLRIDIDTDSQITARVERFLHLILGTQVITPTPAETAMYFAASAAGNSACLSRQVGAAITDASGEVIAVGWNDVPKAGGSLYMADPKNDPQSNYDQRCWNLQGGTCFNDEEKRLIADLIVDELVKADAISEKTRTLAFSTIANNSKLKNLIEFSRSVHAEMHAIINAGKLAINNIQDGKMFITTYPCHNCARHIVAAGIKEVYYIEPYRKSLATKLHSDEAVQTLLSGNVLSWAKFGDYKAGSIQLASPGARRLLHYLLSRDRTKIAYASEDLFDGLIAAWQNTSFDPATAAKPAKGTTHTGTWRLARLETSGFGGLNLLDGPDFVLSLNGENWCLEGQNGSGQDLACECNNLGAHRLPLS
jgi:deoxycytidylate deaminase